MSVLVWLQIGIWGKVNQHWKRCNTNLDDNTSQWKRYVGEDKTWQFCRVIFFQLLSVYIKKDFHMLTQLF